MGRRVPSLASSPSAPSETFDSRDGRQLYGFPDGAWVACMTIDYAIEKQITRRAMAASCDSSEDVRWSGE
jgi:hypothetical protein